MGCGGNCWFVGADAQQPPTQGSDPLTMWRPVPAQVAWFRGSVHRALSLSARLLGPPRQPMNLARVPRRSFAFSRGATQEVDENEAQAEAASAALSVNRSFPASPLQGKPKSCAPSWVRGWLPHSES